MDTTEFAERLDNTIVPSFFSEAEKQQEYEPLIRYIIAHIPESLYKYRRCDERSIDSFDKGRMWAATPESMNDGFDSRMFYNKEEPLQWFEQKVSMPLKMHIEKQCLVILRKYVNASKLKVSLLFQVLLLLHSELLKFAA